MALCLGEGMVVLHAPPAMRGARPDSLDLSVGGAEANVASGLAALGLATTWVSRLGRDPFGSYVEQDLRARGVAVVVEYDEDRPTGAYVKEQGVSGSRMHYYRTGSAATGMTADLFAQPEVAAALRASRLVHTSGITAGILPEDSTVLPALISARDEDGFTLSVDLNWRPALWRGRSLEPLLHLLRAADVLLLGADEALAALGTAEPEALRELVGHRPRIVLKEADHVATDISPMGRRTTVPALKVDVVEAVGAGDGFAAGYLYGLLTDRDITSSLRLGHLVAASVLAEVGDHVTGLPEPQIRERLLGASDAEWSAIRVDSEGLHWPGVVTVGGER
ncbi:sugar kinase [Epidermidibacterium keratini]|uniref:Sugar kinase n=1 Tax=Epidermidibacterium keratini TaxID=1891644 RepID=A0A7L4YKM5_9ACTN|nr:sugar kinase [Epidermidibacterium keratini]QHB99617.1 sugar kinase [Epidermidibacterium keratini]